MAETLTLTIQPSNKKI